jgi:hypothetical protein
MTIDEFWTTLAGLDPESATEELSGRLEKLSASEIAEFQAHFTRVHRQAYDWLLWGAAYLIDGGCSDDGFTDFRYGLISRGRDFFETALQDPDSLADRLSDDDFIPNEELGYVASQVYEAKTGEEMPYPDLPPIGDPKGEDWDFDNPELCAQKLPKLFRRYGEG